MKRYAAPAAVALVLTLGLCIHLQRPFVRHVDAVPAQYAVMAANHLRLGVAQTRLASYEISAPSDQYADWREYCYPNHPFLSVVVTSLWFRLFGVSEAVLRLSLIALALFSLGAFVKLVDWKREARGVGLAAALFALNPMFWYNSIVAVHLAYALAFSLAAWACWIRWDESRPCRILTFVFLFLACQSDWPGYHAALSIALDAFFSRRRLAAASAIALAVACFGLHLLHLYGVDPSGALIRKLLSAGVHHSSQELPSPLSFLRGELRELGVYFTVGLLGLALIGIRRLTRQEALLALFGLDEILFMRWSYVHDYMTFGLTPFFAVAALRGVQELWEMPRRRVWAGALLALAAVQSVVIMSNRLLREGAYEVNWRAALAIREGTRERDRVLITVADNRFLSAYYADRYTAGVEPSEPNLMVHPSGGRVPIAQEEDFERCFPDYSVVLVGDPEAAATQLRCFEGRRPPPEFRFLAPEHPLRRKLESIAISKEERGAFVLYRLHSPR